MNKMEHKIKEIIESHPAWCSIRNPCNAMARSKLMFGILNETLQQKPPYDGDVPRRRFLEISGASPASTYHQFQQQQQVYRYRWKYRTVESQRGHKPTTFHLASIYSLHNLLMFFSFKYICCIRMCTTFNRTR